MRLSATKLSLLIAAVLVGFAALSTWQATRLAAQGATLLASANEASDAFAQTFREMEQQREFELLDQRHAVLATAGAWEAAARVGFMLSALALTAAWLARELARGAEAAAGAVRQPAAVRRVKPVSS